MKITKLEVFALRAPPQQRPHWTSHFIVPTANEILVRLYTDEGIDGFGLATSYTPIDFAVKAWKGGLAQQVLGEDALAPERLYQKLFALTTSKTASEKGWSREAMIRISGDHKVTRALNGTELRLIPVDSSAPLRNANTPAEWQELLKTLPEWEG